MTTEHVANRGSRRGKGRKQTVAETRRALVFGLLAQGKGHQEIAAQLSLSIRRVQDISASFASELAARSVETRTAAVDGAVEAKRIAREAAPAMMTRLVEIASSTSESAADATRAIVAVLDRGGVPAKVEADLGGSLLEEVADLLRAARERARRA